MDSGSDLSGRLGVLTDAELARVFAAAEDQSAVWHACVAECAHRDAMAELERARGVRRLADKRKRTSLHYEWAIAAHAQYLQAEEECRGELVRKGSRVISGFDLWRGSDRFARANCSEELGEWWDVHGRLTIGEYRRQLQASNQEMRELMRDEHVGGHAAGSVRPVTVQGESAAGSGNGERVTVPGHAARAEQRQAGQAGAGGSVRDGRPPRIARAGGGMTGAELVTGAGLARRDRPPEELAKLLDYARAYLTHMAVWPSPAAVDAVAAWIVHAHARDDTGMLIWQASPRLLFQSAEPGCGKSWAMRVTAMTCPKYEIMTEPSEPAVAHTVGYEHGTLFLDECDVLFGAGRRKSAVRAVIQDGYTPDGTWARVRQGKVSKISTYGALAMAGLDSLEHGTSGQLAPLLSRTVRIRMRKAPEGYRPPRLDRDTRFVARQLGAEIALRCAADLDAMAAHVPVLPDGLGNREAEIWEPLLTIGELAGPEDAERMRAACEELTSPAVLPGGADDNGLEELDAIIAGWGDAG